MTGFVRGDIPVGQTKAVDVQIAIAEVLVFVVVESFQRGGLVSPESRDGAIEHRLPISGRTPNCGSAALQAKYKRSALHGM
jgi:hypothetical protein